MSKLDLFSRIFISRDEQALLIKLDDMFWIWEHDITYWDEEWLNMIFMDIKSKKKENSEWCLVAEGRKQYKG